MALQEESQANNVSDNIETMTGTDNKIPRNRFHVTSLTKSNSSLKEKA